MNHALLSYKKSNCFNSIVAVQKFTIALEEGTVNSSRYELRSVFCFYVFFELLKICKEPLLNKLYTARKYSLLIFSLGRTSKPFHKDLLGQMTFESVRTFPFNLQRTLCQELFVSNPTIKIDEANRDVTFSVLNFCRGSSSTTVINALIMSSMYPEKFFASDEFTVATVSTCSDRSSEFSTQECGLKKSDSRAT